MRVSVGDVDERRRRWRVREIRQAGRQGGLLGCGPDDPVAIPDDDASRRLSRPTERRAALPIGLTAGADVRVGLDGDLERVVDVVRAVLAGDVDVEEAVVGPGLDRDRRRAAFPSVRFQPMRLFRAAAAYAP